MGVRPDVLLSDNNLKAALDYIKSQVSQIPETVIILGSGLGYFGENMDIVKSIPTSDIPGYPSPTVQGHKGRLIFGKIKDTYLLAVQGRSHYYEGKPLNSVTFAVQLFAKLGIKNLILTNAAGGVAPHYTPGDFVLINDYINFTQIEVLPGEKQQYPFSPELQNIARKTAEELNIQLHEGTYCWTTGPTFETVAEVQAVKSLGGDLVGMSTVPELIVANHLNMNVLGMSLVTNLAAGISLTPLTHEEVQEAADMIKDSYILLISEIINNIS